MRWMFNSRLQHFTAFSAIFLYFRRIKILAWFAEKLSLSHCSPPWKYSPHYGIFTMIEGAIGYLTIKLGGGGGGAIMGKTRKTVANLLHVFRTFPGHFQGYENLKVNTSFYFKSNQNSAYSVDNRCVWRKRGFRYRVRGFNISCGVEFCVSNPFKVWKKIRPAFE